MQGSDWRNGGARHPACWVAHRGEAELRSFPHNGVSIERSALIQKLAEAHQAPFVLISAPVGYGKSTLLAQWCSQAREINPRYGSATYNRPFAVVTLDSTDNKPAAFWQSIFQAVAIACPDIDRVRLTRWSSQLTEINNIVLPGFIEEIKTNCPRLVLAFDNYQTITEPECHEQVEHLLTHLPPRASLVLATRTDPPLPLARLRASGGIVELRMDDLRFTRAEAAALVRRFGHQVDERDLDHLVECTEGWPAVVHLAARLLRDQPDPAAFLRCFGGANRYVADYLDEEVLRHLPGEVQHFLIRTSILDRFTARLCDAVAGTPNSADLLNGLERSNLFLIPLDGVRTWYRYHRLVGQSLREQLARSDPAAGTTLHRRASAWYERAGRPGDAIEHALAGGDADRALRLIARQWAHYLYRGELAPVRHWLAALGAERVSRSPLGAICAAWLAALSGDRPAAQRWLQTASRLGHPRLLPDGMHSLRGAVALYRSTFGFGGAAEMSAAAHAAAELYRDPASPWYAQARVALGYSRYLIGDRRGAVRPLEQAGEAAADFPILRVQALAVLSLVIGDLGRAAQAADLAAAATDLAAASGLADSCEVTLAHVADAAALVRHGHLLRARQELERTVRRRRTILGLSPWPTLTALVLLVRVMLGLGARDDARALFEEATDLLATLPGGADQLTLGLPEIERRLAEVDRSLGVAPRLTDREEAVLRLLPSSLPLREVAARLFVTVNTVKSHTRLIYRKLGVSSRAEAIRRARELGLL